MIKPDDINVVAGNTILATCVGYGVNPTITWSKGEVTLSNETDSSGRVSVYEETFYQNGLLFIQSILEICSTEDSDTGSYTCTVSSQTSSDQATFNVTVNTLPASLIIVPENSYPVSNSNIALTCVASGYPLPEITWSKDSVEVVNGTDTIIYSEVISEQGERFVQSVLYLCSSEVVDRFQITCTTSNGIPGGTPTSATVNITVEG